MNSRWLPYGLMFLTCFAGVLAALIVYGRVTGSTASNNLRDVLLTKPVRYSRTAEETAFSDASKRLMPAVVSVDRLQSSPFDPSGRPQLSGQGSGVIITKDGYIITNNHVIEGAEEVVVNTGDGKRYNAKIIGADRISDLALLKVDGQNLPAAELGDSDDVRVGEWVMAIGNPLGYEGTLSVGIVSALNRDLPLGPSSAPLVGAIQTDAAINQGNSGGALANIRGQVIGINTQIATPNRGSVGIGFAIPSNRVRKAVGDILKYGRVRHPDLGIRSFAPPYALQYPQVAQEVGPNAPEKGLVVMEILPGSPIAQAGVERWDVIVEIDGKPMATINDYLTYLLKAELGRTARLKYWKRGSFREASVKLGELQEP